MHHRVSIDRKLRPPNTRAAVAAAASAVAILLATSAATAGVHYRLERVASGLAQPTFLAQAPGDPSNIVYYSTRIPDTGTAGFGAINNMGGIFRYDLNTHASTQILSLSSRQLTGDEGLVGFAFSPDFNIAGAPGFHQFYVSSSQYNGGASPIERVERYTYNGNNTSTQSGTILLYNNINTQQNHTVDWIGFDPTTYSHSTGTADRNYLYIVTGDGDLGGSAQNRPEQKANSVLGKVLRVDVDAAHGDAYSDPNKNFAIPVTNPVPLWNASHPATQRLVGTHLSYSGGTITTADYDVQPNAMGGELYATGTRNSFRTSIDRQTGDLWMGDVGENTREEINFLKAGTYDGTQPPVDFGYASREGTTATNAGLAVANSSGATSLQWNTGSFGVNAMGTFTVTHTGSLTINSTNPVREGDHSATNTADHPNAPRSSYIGGYVYRGPIPELQGKYIYADFVNSNIFMVDGIDRNMPLSSYSGTNFNLDPTSNLAALGNRTNAYHAGFTVSGVTPLDGTWSNLVVDPANPGLPLRIGRVVSFGEDESGNVYVVDFGGNFGDPSFGQDYPGPGKGQIFRLTPATINSTWNVNGDGNWSPDANWVGGVPTGSPNGPGDTASFGNSGSPRTITVDGPKTIGGITFDSSQSYTIAGAGPLTFQGLNGAGAFANVNNGTHTISAPIVLNSDLTVQVLAPLSQLTFTDPAPNMTGRTITKLGLGLAQFTNIRADALIATDGITRISLKEVANSPGGTSVVKTLTIGNNGGTGGVDLTNNSLVIDYTGPVGTLVDDTRANLLSSRLFSTAAGSGTTLGYGDNAVLGRTTFGGVNVDASSVLIKLTYAGDANLDGQVDVTDLGALATNWQTSAPWTGGDFSYNGFVDVTDLGILATNWQVGVGNPLSSVSLQEALVAVGLGGISVPEPAGALTLSLGILLASSSRRRRD